MYLTVGAEGVQLPCIVSPAQGEHGDERCQVGSCDLNTDRDHAHYWPSNGLKHFILSQLG